MELQYSMAEKTMKDILKRLLVFIAVFIIIVGMYMRIWEPGIDIDIHTSAAISLTVFYDNGQVGEYRYDDAHMTAPHPLRAGRQTVHIPVSASGMERLRLDFGNVPSTVTIYSVALHISPFQVCALNGERIFEQFSIQNDIADSQFADNAVVYQIIGTDGFIASDIDLLESEIPVFPPKTLICFITAIIIAAALSFLDIVLSCLRKTFQYIAAVLKKICRVVRAPRDRKERILGFIACIVSAGAEAVFIDGVILKVLYRMASFLSMDTLTRYFSNGQHFSWARTGFFFSILLVVMLAVWLGKNTAIRWRYVLALVLLTLMTIGQFTGSSLGFYDGMLLGNTENYQSSTLLGNPQGIRGDEWATEKPQYFAQINGGEDMPYFNDKVMLDGADMVVSAFAPVKDPIIVFRPSLLGFLFLPGANAFAFYWWLRIIGLFMSAYEICRLISGRVRYGIGGAFLFTFSPAVRWWLSQTLTDMMIYGFFAVCLYHLYLTGKTKISRWFSLVGVFYFLTCYILTMYPASQVPTAYILLGLVIWIIIKNWDKRPFALQRIGAYMLTALPFIACLVRFAVMSGPAIGIMLNTHYPGASRPWIPLPAEYPLYRLVNPFTALIRHPSFSNSCEISQFYTLEIVLIPLVILLTRRYGKKMLLSNLLCFVSTILLAVAWLPQIPLLNKITLLEMSYPVRILIACGIGYTLTLISVLPILEETFPVIKKTHAEVICFAGCMGLLTCATNCQNVFDYFMAFRFGIMLLILSAILYCGMAYLLMQGGRKACSLLMILLTGLSIVSTVCIDPITCGTDSMFEKSTMAAIRQLDVKEQGRWMVSGSPTIANLTAAQGVAVIGGTYYYPDWTMMEIIDPEHKFESYWNQYAHIDMRLTDGELQFENVDGVNRIIYIGLETAQSIGVKYIFTNVGVPEKLLSDGSLELCYADAVDSWEIYKII